MTKNWSDDSVVIKRSPITSTYLLHGLM
jgi:hypothetical protein